MTDTTLEAFQQFLDIIKKLRSPEGCPWDNEQTADSLKPNIIEEAYECVDAITTGDNDHIREELGDLFLLATMTAYIKEQENSFSVKDVLAGISEKLVRRHPHVFSDANADNPDAVIKQWNEIKKQEKKGRKENSILHKASRTLPPLERALILQKTAAKVGFDWQQIGDVWSKVEEEMDELKDACLNETQNGIEDELGDLLFSIVNIARFLNVDPMIALHGANQKFCRRFYEIEKVAEETGKSLESMQLREMDSIWNQAKNQKREK